MSNTAAVILAGGKGTRMDILCHVRPKPALPFAGGFRVIDFSLSNCLYSGISNIAILTDYQRSSMANYLKQFQFIPPLDATAEFYHMPSPWISRCVWFHLGPLFQNA